MKVLEFEKCRDILYHNPSILFLDAEYIPLSDYDSNSCYYHSRSDRIDIGPNILKDIFILFFKDFKSHYLSKILEIFILTTTNNKENVYIAYSADGYLFCNSFIICSFNKNGDIFINCNNMTSSIKNNYKDAYCCLFSCFKNDIEARYNFTINNLDDYNTNYKLLVEAIVI